MTGTVCNAPEIRPEMLDFTPIQRAKSRHSEVLSICEHLVQALHAWGRLGKLCTLVERDKDWELLGYASFGSWMMKIEEVSGYSRAAAYSYAKLYRDLEPLWGAEVHELSLGTANVVRQLPSALQRNPEVRHAAKRMKPKQFREKIADEYPDSHIEVREEVRLNLDGSFVPIFHEVIEAMRVIEDDPLLSYERALELAFLAWINELWGEPEAGITNLARARQLRGLAAGEIRRGGKSV